MLKNFHYNCNKLGNIKNLKVEQIKIKKLKKNYVRVEIQAIGINYVDILKSEKKMVYGNLLIKMDMLGN